MKSQGSTKVISIYSEGDMQSIRPTTIETFHSNLAEEEKVRRSLKSLGYILWALGICVPNFMEIHPTYFTKSQKCQHAGGTRQEVWG